MGYKDQLCDLLLMTAAVVQAYLILPLYHRNKAYKKVR